VRTFCGAALSVLTIVAAAAGQTPAAQGTTTTTTQTAVTQDEIVLQGETTPRPALPTFYGDTGLWMVSTAETLPAGRWSLSAFRANWDRRQGLTDVNQIGLTGAFGIGDRFEVFGSWRTVRLDRDVRPTFVPTEPVFGGVSQEFPYVRRGWSKTLGGPVIVGGKYSLVSQSRGDALSIAPRVMVKFPSGSTWASTNDWDGHFDLIIRREFSQQVSGEHAVLQSPVLIRDTYTVHPDPVHADRGGRETRIAAGQVEHAALGAAIDRGRVEQEQIGVVAGLQRAAAAHAEELRRLAGQAPSRVREREHAAAAHPVPEQVQAEAGVVEEREVRAGVRERDQARRVLEHAPDGGFVGVEQQRAEHRIEVLAEREIEHAVQRVAAIRQLGDRALLRVLALRLDDLHLVPLAVEQAEVRRAGDLFA